MDVADHIVADERLRVPETAAGAFDVLAEHGILPPELGRSLGRMVGFRNILVHEYARLDAAIVLRVLRQDLGEIQAFRDAVLRYLNPFQPSHLEVVNQRRAERLVEPRAELLVRGMPEVRLQAVEIVEVEDDEVIGGVGDARLVAGAVDDAPADADVAHGGDLADRALERGKERVALGVGQIGPRFHQHNVRHHLRTPRTCRTPRTLEPLEPRPSAYRVIGDAEQFVHDGAAQVQAVVVGQQPRPHDSLARGSRAMAGTASMPTARNTAIDRRM